MTSSVTNCTKRKTKSVKPRKQPSVKTMSGVQTSQDTFAIPSEPLMDHTYTQHGSQMVQTWAQLSTACRRHQP